MSISLVTLVSCSMNQAVEPQKTTEATGYILANSETPVPVPTFSGTEQKGNF